MIKLLLFIAALYAFSAALAWLVSDRMIFLPPPSSYDANSVPITLVRTEDGAQIAVLHLPNPGARFTLLFSHGNAEDLGYLAPFLSELHAAGFAVLAYDYRGYGLSSGPFPSERGAYSDANAVYRYATQQLGIPPTRLILHGRSVGVGPAMHLAASVEVAGLVIESGFVSAYRVLTHVPLFPYDKFQNLRMLPRLRCPVFVIHGLEDEVIPSWHGKRLFDSAVEPKSAWWVAGAGHNDLAVVAGDEYLRQLAQFAQRLGGASSGAMRKPAG